MREGTRRRGEVIMRTDKTMEWNEGSRGTEILITESSTKIKPTDPFKVSQSDSVKKTKILGFSDQFSGQTTILTVLKPGRDQGRTRLSPVDHILHGTFVLVQKDSHTQRDFCSGTKRF